MIKRCTVLAGEIISEYDGTTHSILVADAITNLVATVDTDQSISQFASYWPFGEPQLHLPSSLQNRNFGGSIGYYSQYQGMRYVRARVLSSVSSRWLTVDPVYYEDAYAYAHNNPTTYTDPSGLMPNTGHNPKMPGCTPAQKQTIMKHFNDVCVNRVKRVKDAKLRKCLERRCKSMVIACEHPVRPTQPCLDPVGLYCAYTYPVPGMTITLCPRAFDEGLAPGACGCLGSKILHEMAHSCGFKPEDVPLECERQAFNQVRPPCTLK